MASSAVDLAVLLEQHLDTITERGTDTVCRLLLSRDRISDPEDVNACVFWGWQAMIEMLAFGVAVCVGGAPARDMPAEQAGSSVTSGR